MKLLFSAVVSTLFLIPVTAHAQIGVYVNPMFTRVSNSQADTGPFAFLGEGTTSRSFWGVNLGGYDDFFHGKNVDAGIDIRDMTVGANNARMNSFMVGARVVAKSLSPSWRPYVQLSGGVGSTRAPHTSLKANRARYGIYVGADYKLNRYMDLRAFEIGYGSLTTVSNASVGNTQVSYPASRLIEASAGLVFRIR